MSKVLYAKRLYTSFFFTKNQEVDIYILKCLGQILCLGRIFLDI